MEASILNKQKAHLLS